MSVCRLVRLGSFLSRRSFGSSSSCRVAPSYQSELLKDRACVEVKGSEAAQFLQGLITNDIKHVLDGEKAAASDGDVLLRRSLYALFLNTQGRVLFDTIVFHVDDESFLLDCDRRLAPALLDHLKMFRLRKKIDLSVSDKFECWSLFRTDGLDRDDDPSFSTLSRDFVDLGLLQDCRCCFATSDPRVKALGFRLLAHTGRDTFCYQLRELDGPEEYSSIRYRLGVPEGSLEIVSGKALPLEFNADFLHGVSFHKGCYVGQELTARTHHTGVVRKRVMPVEFRERLPKGETLPPEEAVLENEKGKAVGKLIRCGRSHGIGLMRLQESSEARSIRVKGRTDVELTAKKPFWWPKVSPRKLH